MNDLMLTAIISIIVIVLILILLKLYNKKVKQNIMNKTIEILNNFGEVKQQNNSFYFLKNNIEYRLYFQFIPKNKEVSINSKNTWEIIDHPSKFINQDKLNQDDSNKIVVIFPTTERIKRYINESDVEFLGFKKVYSYHAILFTDLEKFAKGL